VALAFNNLQAQFFYWRLVLLLFMLYFVMLRRPPTAQVPAC
jgi:hypothetical protein